MNLLKIPIKDLKLKYLYNDKKNINKYIENIHYSFDNIEKIELYYDNSDIYVEINRQYLIYSFKNIEKTICYNKKYINESNIEIRLNKNKRIVKYNNYIEKMFINYILNINKYLIYNINYVLNKIQIYKSYLGFNYFIYITSINKRIIYHPKENIYISNEKNKILFINNYKINYF